MLSKKILYQLKKELHGDLDTLWSEYTLFNHKNDPFDRN